MYILGIDFGTKKIGAAILEDTSGICSPLPVILNDKKMWEHLATLIADFRISTVVLGLPSYASTEKKVQQFAATLQEKHALAVYFTQEDNTSIAIKKELSTQKQKKNLDSYSAVEILQQWISETAKDT